MPDEAKKDGFLKKTAKQVAFWSFLICNLFLIILLLSIGLLALPCFKQNTEVFFDIDFILFRFVNSWQILIALGFPIFLSIPTIIILRHDIQNQRDKTIKRLFKWNILAVWLVLLIVLPVYLGVTLSEILSFFSVPLISIPLLFHEGPLLMTGFLLLTVLVAILAIHEIRKRKPVLGAIVFKYVKIAIILSLLITAIYFQSSWKAIAVLLVFFAAVTVFPKPARKWFWRSVGVIVIAIIAWVFLPDNPEWKPYIFDKELSALEAKYEIPDEENAAWVYNQIFNNKELSLSPPDKYLRELNATTSHLAQTRFWQSGDYPEIAQWLKENNSAITTLFQASKLNKCHFRFSLNPFEFNSSRRISMFRCAKLLISAANNDIGEGRIDAGLEKYYCILQMAKHLYQQPTTMDLWSSNGCQTLMLENLNRFIIESNATDIHLNTIENALADTGYDWGLQLSKVLEYEKAHVKNSLIGHFYQEDKGGKAKLCCNLAIPVNAMYTENEKRWFFLYSTIKFVKAITILNWLHMPSNPREATKVVDAAFVKLYAMTEPNFNWLSGPRGKDLLICNCNLDPRLLEYRSFARFMRDNLEESCHIFHYFHLRTNSAKRVTLLLIGLRRYKNKFGNLPESLEDIKNLALAEAFVDPMNGGSFAYKRVGENFTLYSKGINNIDENGDSLQLIYYKKGEPDDVSFWPAFLYKIK